MDEGREAAIRDRAYQLWQESGGAHGHAEEHWRQAEAELGGGAQDAIRKVSGEVEPGRHADGVSPLPAGGT